MAIIHPDLFEANKFAYEPSGLVYKNLFQERESQEYGACYFEIHNQYVIFRSGKITPKKIGLFVTLWKRSPSGLIKPYDSAHPLSLCVVSVRNAEHFGQFVFPKAVLIEKGFVSIAGQGGKLAMRVYPPWDMPSSLQAQKTQAWQSRYFFEIYHYKPVDTSTIQRLFQAPQAT